MIIKDDDAIKRLNSPMNLINQLRGSSGNGKNNAMSLFGIGRKKEEVVKELEEVKISFNPFRPSEAKEQSLVPKQVIPSLQPALPQQAPTKLDNILENHESQIKLGLAHDNALDLLNKSVELLVVKLDEVKADKLPSVISAASKTVESIRKERLAANNHGAGNDVHYHFYTPQQKSLSDYEVIDVEAQ